MTDTLPAETTETLVRTATTGNMITALVTIAVATMEASSMTEGTKMAVTATIIVTTVTAMEMKETLSAIGMRTAPGTTETGTKGKSGTETPGLIMMETNGGTAEIPKEKRAIMEQTTKTRAFPIAMGSRTGAAMRKAANTGLKGPTGTLRTWIEETSMILGWDATRPVTARRPCTEEEPKNIWTGTTTPAEMIEISLNRTPIGSAQDMIRTGIQKETETGAAITRKVTTGAGTKPVLRKKS